MTPTSIEHSLRAAINDEKRRSGDDHIDVAFRLNDLAKYLASRKRFLDAELAMNEAVFVTACNTLATGLPWPFEDATPLIEGYEILLKVLGVDKDQRMARVQAILDRAAARINKSSIGVAS